MFIATIYKGMHNSHLVATRIEIKAYGERQPFTTCLATMHALGLDHSRDLAGTLHLDFRQV